MSRKYLIPILVVAIVLFPHLAQSVAVSKSKLTETHKASLSPVKSSLRSATYSNLLGQTLKYRGASVFGGPYSPAIVGTNDYISTVPNSFSGARVILQDDCNLVLYSQYDVPVWSTGTYQPIGNRNCQLSVEIDGNLLLYNNGKVIWKSNTPPVMASGRGATDILNSIRINNNNPNSPYVIVYFSGNINTGKSQSPFYQQYRSAPGGTFTFL